MHDSEPGRVSAGRAGESRRAKGGGRWRGGHWAAAWLMLCIGVPLFVAVGMIIVNSRLFDDDDGPAGNAPKDQVVDHVEASSDGPSARLRDLQRTVPQRIDELESIDRSQAVGLTIDDAGDLLARAEAALAEKRFDVAESLYEQAAKRVDDVHALDRQRGEARAAREAAAKTIADSQSVDDVDGLPAARRLAERRTFTAQVYFSEGRFDEAAAAWREAGELVARHIARDRGLKRVAAARARYETALEGGPAKAVLDVAGGEAWCGVAHLLHEARGAADDDRFDDAVALYDRAAAAVPSILHAVARRTLKFRAYVAGYQSAQALMAHRDGEPFDAAHAEALASQYASLKLPRVLIDQLPAGRPAATRDLGALMLTDVPAAVERIHDAPARASFNVGTQMLILRQLLEQLTGDLADAHRQLLSDRITLLHNAAVEAEYDPAMVDALAGLQDALKLKGSEPIDVLRVRVDAIAQRLDQLDGAVAWMGQ